MLRRIQALSLLRFFARPLPHKHKWNCFFNQGQVKLTAHGHAPPLAASLLELNNHHISSRELCGSGRLHIFLYTLSANAFPHKERFQRLNIVISDTYTLNLLQTFPVCGSALHFQSSEFYACIKEMFSSVSLLFSFLSYKSLKKCSASERLDGWLQRMNSLYLKNSLYTQRSK